MKPTSKAQQKTKTNKMKRYQVRRWDKRNTLRARKYAVPFLFLMWLTMFGMAYSMTL